MIRLEGVDLTLRLGAQLVRLLERVDFSFDAPRIAILAREPRLRSALMLLLAGTLLPQRGRLARSGTVSWPIGQTGMFRCGLDGFALVSFLCDLYHRPHRRARALVQELLDEPDVLRHPFIRWPRTSQMQFAYAAALIPRFDVYLIDGSLRLPHPVFGPRFETLLGERLRRSQLIVATSQVALIKALAPQGVELEGGRLELIDDLDDHLRRHRPGHDDAAPPAEPLDQSGDQNVDLF